MWRQSVGAVTGDRSLCLLNTYRDMIIEPSVWAPQTALTGESLET